MTNEEKQLLLKDLSARTLYGVMCWVPNGSGAICKLRGIVKDICYFDDNPRYGYSCSVEWVKPYLRPVSSMTDEEKEEFISFNGTDGCYIKTMDFCNKHHLDNRGLIPMGLALEAPEDMY